MITFKIMVISIIFVFILSSCSGLKEIYINSYNILHENYIEIYRKNIDLNYRLNGNKNTGIVFGSLSQDNTQTKFKAEQVVYNIQSNEGLKIQIVSREQVPLLPLFNKDDFQDINGRVFALSLPEGEYSLKTWQIIYGTTYVYPRKEPNDIKFNIKNGEITYIGNLHMIFSTSNFANIFKLVVSGVPILVDNYERDSTHLSLIYPQLDPWLKKQLVKKEIAFTGPWTTIKEDAELVNMTEVNKVLFRSKNNKKE